MSEFNWLDWVIAIILTASTLAGFGRGFARIVIGLAATILGLLCAFGFYRFAGDWLIPYVSHKGVAYFIGFALIFIGVQVVGALIGMALTRMFKWVGLSWLNRLLGGAFGFVRGLLFAIILVLAMLAFSPQGQPPPRPVVESTLAPHMLESARVLSWLAPSEVNRGFKESYEQLKQLWQQTIEKLPVKQF